MTDGGRLAIRRALMATVRERDSPPANLVVASVAEQTGDTTDAARAELDRLEREGEVYLVGDREEVRLP